MRPWNSLKQNETDILFLDVEMPGSTGFQLLDVLTYMPKKWCYHIQNGLRL